MRKKVSVVVSFVLTAVLLAGCGGSLFDSDSSSKYASEPEAAGAYAYADEAVEEYSDDIYAYSEEGSTAENAAPKEAGGEAPSDSEIMSNSNRKLIKTVNMTAETREFDKLIANVTDRIDTLGGYAESMDISGNSYDSKGTRNAFIVARIPASKLDFFVNDIADASNITNKSESAEDVTLQYADVEAHKESLKIEQARLNELLEKADTLENIIELENRLAEVRYEIESYESRLRMMNNQVVYSTVNLSVVEVKEYTPEPVEEKTFGQRLSEEFLDSCETAWEAIQDFIIGFIAFLPMLLVILIILFVLFMIVFGIVKAIIAIVKRTGKKRPPKEKKDKADQKTVVAQALDAPPEKTEEENK